MATPRVSSVSGRGGGIITFSDRSQGLLFEVLRFYGTVVDSVSLCNLNLKFVATSMVSVCLLWSLFMWNYRFHKIAVMYLSHFQVQCRGYSHSCVSCSLTCCLC